MEGNKPGYHWSEGMDFRMSTSPSLDDEAQENIKTLLNKANESGDPATFLYHGIHELGIRSKVALLLQLDTDIYERFTQMHNEHQEAARFGMEIGITPAPDISSHIKTKSALLGTPNYIVEADIRRRAINIGQSYPAFLDDDLWDEDSRFKPDDGLPRRSYGDVLTYEEAVNHGIKTEAMKFMQHIYYPSVFNRRDPKPNSPNTLTMMFKDYVNKIPDSYIVKRQLTIRDIVQACDDLTTRFRGNHEIERDMEEVKKVVQFIVDLESED